MRIFYAIRNVACLGIACLLCLVACSSPPKAPRGLGELSFGDPVPVGAVPVLVALPSALADALKFYRRPGRNEDFLGVGLTDPVWAFYQDRFFSVAAGLAQPGEGHTLRARLTKAYGPPYCRDTAKLAVCLWRMGDVDAVLEVPAQGPARFMLRHRPLAGLVAAAGGGQAPPGLDTAPGTPRIPGQ